MSDIRSLGVNGKLIYQLTSASALKDTDLFPISSADNLTRKVSLGQIKASINNDYYNKEDMATIIDDLKMQVKGVYDKLFSVEGNITEFRNEFNNILNTFEGEFNSKLESTETSLTTQINEVKTDLSEHESEYSTYKDSVAAQFNTVNSKIDSNYTDLEAKVNNAKSELNTQIISVQTSLTESINNAKSELSTQITNVNNSLSERINNAKSELSTQITNVNNSLSERINSVEDSLIQKLNVIAGDVSSLRSDFDTYSLETTTTINWHGTLIDLTRTDVTNLTQRVDNLILTGTSIPTTLESGQVYLQYF